MAALHGSKRHGEPLRFVVFDVPYLAGVDLRSWPCPKRRNRLELLARAFEERVVLSPLVEASEALALDMIDGRIEGIVLKACESTYRDGWRAGWWKVKEPPRWEREAWRFERR